MTDLLCVHPDHVPMVWPAVRDMLRAAHLKTDIGHSIDLETDVLGGKGVLWLASTDSKIDAACVTVLTRTDLHKVCVITCVGGTGMRGWLHMLEPIEAWAKAEGAAKVRFFGRPGWARVLEGYRVSNVVMEKAL